jgi:HK97 family phage major capsid protein
MKTMNIETFKSALQKAADLKGEAGMIAQKSLILEGYMITDENGLAVDPSTLDIVVRAAKPAEEMEEDMMDEKLEEKVASAVKKSLASQIADTRFAVAAEPKAWSNAKEWGRLKHLKSKETAFNFGTWCLAAMGHKKSADYCARNGLILTKGHQEGVNTQGGFLVPDLMENELISLREQYGVFRRNARVFPMQGDTLRIPKRLTGLTAYFVGETAAGTESTQTFDSVQLVAKKLMALTTVSNELLEDAVVAIGDDIAGEIAYQFAFKEDDAGFNGTGTSTYGGIVGLATALSDSTYQVSNSDVAAAFAKLPAWAAQRQNIKIFTNKGTFHSVFERLAMSAGGTTAAEIASGLTTPKFFGYPVEFSQAIAVPADSDTAVLAYLGDMSQGCYFGDKRQTSIAFSDSALNAFEQDERVVRGSQRFDIVCANVGSSSASGALIKFTL